VESARAEELRALPAPPGLKARKEKPDLPVLMAPQDQSDLKVIPGPQDQKDQSDLKGFKVKPDPSGQKAQPVLMELMVPRVLKDPPALKALKEK
jgi:hypothetical protein